MIKSDEYTEDWHKRTVPGVVPTCIVLGLIMLVAITANLIEYV